MAWTISDYNNQNLRKASTSNIRHAMSELCIAINERQAHLGETETPFMIGTDATVTRPTHFMFLGSRLYGDNIPFLYNIDLIQGIIDSWLGGNRRITWYKDKALSKTLEGSHYNGVDELLDDIDPGDWGGNWIAPGGILGGGTVNVRHQNAKMWAQLQAAISKLIYPVRCYGKCRSSSTTTEDDWSYITRYHYNSDTDTNDYAEIETAWDACRVTSPVTRKLPEDGYPNLLAFGQNGYAYVKNIHGAGAVLYWKYGTAGSHPLSLMIIEKPVASTSYIQTKGKAITGLKIEDRYVVWSLRNFFHLDYASSYDDFDFSDGSFTIDNTGDHGSNDQSYFENTSGNLYSNSVNYQVDQMRYLGGVIPTNNPWVPDVDNYPSSGYESGATIAVSPCLLNADETTNAIYSESHPFLVTQVGLNTSCRTYWEWRVGTELTYG
jgi:hypothetical protein